MKSVHRSSSTAVLRRHQARGLGRVALLAIVAVTMPVIAHANLIYLSASRSVTSSASNSLGASDTDSQSTTNFAPFDATSTSVAGESDGVSRQVSTFDPFQISLNETASVETSLVGGATSAQAAAGSFFQVSFQVLEPLPFHITGARNVGAFNVINPTLTSPSGDIPLPFLLNGGIEIDISGILQPGIYTLTGNVQTSSLSQSPIILRDSNQVALRLNLAVAAVPDTASSALLFAFALGLVALSRKSATLRRVLQTGSA